MHHNTVFAWIDDDEVSRFVCVSYFKTLDHILGAVAPLLLFGKYVIR